MAEHAAALCFCQLIAPHGLVFNRIMPEMVTIWRRLWEVADRWRRKHWRRALFWRERVQLNEEAVHLLLAGGIGIAAGLVNLAFFGFHHLLEWLLIGDTGNMVEMAGHLAYWRRLMVPAVGGLAAGLILYYGLRLLGNPGLSNLLEVVVAGDGRLAFRAALVNALSSLVSISSGASIGREGTITQMSATVASKSGQLLKWPPYRMRLMVACGAAAGIAAAYNAPLAGALFAALLVLGNFSMNLFAPLVVAAVVAAVFSRIFFGMEPAYNVRQIESLRLIQLPLFIVLGAVAGVFAVGFLKLLQLSDRWWNRLTVPLYFRMGLAGLLVGIISLEYPEVWGNGADAINRLLNEDVVLTTIAGLLLAKLVATTATVGSGTVGGVITPTLFLGAAVGSLFDGLLHKAGWDVALYPTTFALAGMAAMFAATTHSPLLAMTLVFELSLNYSLMPPLMLASVVATLVARRLHRESIYSEPLRRKGLEWERESQRAGAATEKTVGDVMREPVAPLHETAPFREIADRFLGSSNNFLPVVDGGQKLIGVVALQDLKEHLNAGAELTGVIALDVMRPPPAYLTPNLQLIEALPVLLASELQHVPVVSDPKRGRLVGAVNRGEVLALFREALARKAVGRV